MTNARQKLSISVSQLLIYPILFFLRALVVRDKLSRVGTLSYIKQNESNTKYIIYANHQSYLDPLLICACFTPKEITRLMPFRFFVKNQFLSTPPLSNFLKIMGGFPAHYCSRTDYGLKMAAKLMSLNQTIVIFPQGKRTGEKIAKSGISVLASKPNVHLIPVKIEWIDRFSCKIIIGAPFKGSGYVSSAQLMKKVYALNSRAN